MYFFRVYLSWFPCLRPVLLYTLSLYLSRRHMYTQHVTSFVLVPHLVPLWRLTLPWHCVAALLPSLGHPDSQSPAQGPDFLDAEILLGSWAERSSMGEDATVWGDDALTSRCTSLYMQGLNEKQKNHQRKKWPNTWRSRYLRHIINRSLEASSSLSDCIGRWAGRAHLLNI